MHAISCFGYISGTLSNCAAPAPDSDAVLVVEEEVFLCTGHAKEATTKTSTDGYEVNQDTQRSSLTLILVVSL